MIRTLSLLCAVFMLWTASPAAAEDLSTTTVLPVKLSADRVAPGSAVKIRYNWQATRPLPQDNTAFVHFVDAAGKTAYQADHTPSIVTGSPGWNGTISYEQRVLIPAALADGEYKIYMGLYHSITEAPKWVRVAVKAGPGTQDVGEQRVQAGILKVDKTAPLPPADTEKVATLNLEGWKMTFNEDFDAKLDASPWGPGTRWICHTPWNGDFGDAAFGDPAEGHPFTIEKGILRIEARKSDEFAKVDQYKRPWRAGLLSSNDASGKGFSQQYGYFECKAKMPKGPGVWPAFWLGSSFDRKDPKAGETGAIEIDVIEYYGHNPSAYQSAVHVWEPKPHRGEGSTITTKLDEATNDFHRYGVLVEPDFITMYFDGIEVWKTKTPPQHNKPLMLLVNLALGSGWPIDKTPNPSYMYVDYIRAYARQ